MVYSSSSDTEQLAVFSETWYNGETGWIATVNGKEVPILRTNYILRAIEVPAGNNEIVMEFGSCRTRETHSLEVQASLGL